MSDDAYIPSAKQMRMVKRFKRFAAAEYGFDLRRQDAFVMGILHSQTNMTASEIRGIRRMMENGLRAVN